MVIPPLETNRLWLRPLALDDAPAIQRRFPRWEVVRYLATVPWPYPEDGAETFIRRSLEEMAAGTKLHWTLRVKGELDEAVGVISLWPDDSNREQRGFWIDPEYSGRGLMTEAADRIVDYAFGELGWTRLYLTNAVPNVGSRRIKEKQGARLVAQERKRFVSGELEREIWLLDAEDWRRRRV